jgi:hypothetical protein
MKTKNHGPNIAQTLSIFNKLGMNNIDPMFVISFLKKKFLMENSPALRLVPAAV